MRHLDELRLRESSDHEALHEPWRYDIDAFRCRWALADGGLEVEMEMSTHERRVLLRFRGVTDLRIEKDLSECAVRILDASRFQPEVTAPIRVEPRQGGDGLSFWAQSVESVALD